MPQDLIRYDLLVQDALKGVVRRVLTDAATEGMPGEHHFYISFRTQDPGVRISQRLRDKYPDEMTIVLQHQFWDLSITEHAFEVGLSFSGIPERLLVPFESLTGFFDPSVQFGLKFELSSTEPADNDEDGQDDDVPAGPGAGTPPAPIPLAAPQRRAEAPDTKPAALKPKIAPAKAPAREADRPTRAKGESQSKPESVKPEGAKPADDKPATNRPAAKAAAKAEPADKGDGAEVVSLDAFRKKP